MGNDAKLFCTKCNSTFHIGRAYRLNQDYMNKRMPDEVLEMFIVAVKRFQMSLQKIPLFNIGYEFEYFNEHIEFLTEHKGHAVYLIDDYFDEEKKHG